VIRFPCAAALLLAVAAGCGVAEAQPPRDSLLVTPAWLALRLADPEVVVLQIDRDPTGCQTGHIPGARFVPLDAIMVARDGVPNELPPQERLDSVLEAAGVSTESRIVIYGDPLAAARMFFTLDYLGVGDRAALLERRAAEMEGGGVSPEHRTLAGPAGPAGVDTSPACRGGRGMGARPSRRPHGRDPECPPRGGC
jgi:thiosulfate/3-mercaptopyruvate sulfurtransferase